MLVQTQITFDGQVGGTAKTFNTEISNTFIAGKTAVTTPNNDDEIIIQQNFLEMTQVCLRYSNRH